jgi:hypothetical protein
MWGLKGFIGIGEYKKGYLVKTRAVWQLSLCQVDLEMKMIADTL